ncbi:DNA sulfur modification protein DndB [Streptomyces sp. MS1.HAVA.3]|uniref:DNA sulfur modification protein DndB n=1 Tax=Streptomyces caledonius TaxID=3134107 RepID=A0ABU8U773_9ACTN
MTTPTSRFAPQDGIQLAVNMVRIAPSDDGTTDAAAGVVVGAAYLPTVLSFLPNPLEEEAYVKAGDTFGRRNAEMRTHVQRSLKGTTKGKNVPEYADYMASGFRGELGGAFSTPPIAIWAPSEDGEPAVIWDPVELLPHAGVYAITVPTGSRFIAIDGETQVTALHSIYNRPELHGLTARALSRIRVPYELYWGCSVEEARQIFHDRNVKGVAMDKNLAISMDQRDIATAITRRLADSVKVPVNGELVPFSTFVKSQGRQLTASDKTLVTLSGLRALVVTTLLGRPGIPVTSGSVTVESIASREDDEFATSVEAKEAETIRLLSRIITALYEKGFAPGAKGSAINAPAVLAGIGVAAHHATAWADPNHTNALSEEALMDLLADIRWERSALFWDGAGGKAAPKTKDPHAVSFAGGIKDSGGRVADAILNPTSVIGRRIRGQ